MRQALSVFLSLLVAYAPLTALSSEWGAHIGSGGFMGSSITSASFKADHKVRYKLGLGVTPALGRKIYQFNLGAAYEPFTPSFEGKRMAWHPFALAVTAVYTPNKEFFMESPGAYPERGYYQPTALHGLITLSTKLLTKVDKTRLNFEYFISVPHHYLIARYNNDRWRSNFCCSSGFELSIPF